MAARISAAGTTSSRRQPFVWPTSMYSMKRRVWPLPWKKRAIGRTLSSLTPRLTTMFTLTGQAGGGGRIDAGENARDGEVDVVQRAEDLVLERVEADGDPVEAGGSEGTCLLRKERAVRRHGQVEAWDVGEHRDELLDVTSQQRLAAGQPDLLDSMSRQDPRQPLDLLEREELGAREEAVAAPEDLLRHAVGAAEVAAVRDRDAEVSKRSSQAVERHRPKGSPGVFGPFARVPQGSKDEGGSTWLVSVTRSKAP